MKASRLARRQLRNHARYRGRNDINIVPMLDVMVILTFFLIFTAVFSRTSILEVHLPAAGDAEPSPVPGLRLEVVVRRAGLVVQDPGVGVLATLPATGTAQDLAGLTRELAGLKGRYPDETRATLRVAEDVDYDTIVQVMDAVRVRQSVEGGRVSSTSLFPTIALGDAPT